MRPADLPPTKAGEEALPSGPAATSSLSWCSSKIQARHHERLAVVYVRQSTTQQVVEHPESTAWQYDLVRRAVALGWSRPRVLIIDEDLGRSGQSAEGRPGFQRLLAEVALDHVGLILGIEMSRLARSCRDWHQLLELCSRFGTLLADQDGLYDTTDHNDRLLLGLKGTMSEAELHVLQSRLYQGKLNKARRGELVERVPIGYVLLPSGEVAFEPDEQAQTVVRLVFDKFDELQSVNAVLRYMGRNHVHLGIRPHDGPDRGVLRWRPANRSTLLDLLRHPMYAGAYCYGRHRRDPRRVVPGKPGSGRILVPADQCEVLLRDHYPAYITWERYQRNLLRLADNQARAESRGVPRQGAGLLAGLVVCGLCGHRMLVNYHRKARVVRYACKFHYSRKGGPLCQSLAGRHLDELVGQQVLIALEPAALELSLEAAADIERERQQLERHWQQRLERARYEEERAAQQYHAVEPENRLVARELERRWEQALLELHQLQEDHDRFRRDQPPVLSDTEREMIRALASDIPSLWRVEGIRIEDRKTIVRHLIERVVVTPRGPTELLDVKLHWVGGFSSQHELSRPVARYDRMRDYERLLARMVELRGAELTHAEVAERLNREGWPMPRPGGSFTGPMVGYILRRNGYGTKGPAAQSLGQGEWWTGELTRRIGIHRGTLLEWVKRGWVNARRPDGPRSRWILWADKEELGRLRRLRDRPRGWTDDPVPTELTTPKGCPET